MSEKEDVKRTTPSEIIDKIIALTYTRHAGLPYKDFAGKVGLDPEKEESVAVREGSFKLIRAITKSLFEVINEINGITQILTLYCDNKGEQNGKHEAK